MSEKILCGNGRPSKAESEQRRRDFLRLVSKGVNLDEAARRARIKPARALRILSHPHARQLLSLLDQRAA